MVEAHGSGNPSEDKIESEALQQVFSDGRSGPTAPCALGSVKSVIGHAGAAAGLASVVKASLSLYQEIIPPLPGFTQPPADLWQPGLFHIPRFPSYWAGNRKDGPRRATAGAMTTDGNVMHIVLRAYEPGLPDPVSASDTTVRIQREREFPLGLNTGGLFVAEADSQHQLAAVLEDLGRFGEQWANDGIPIGAAARIWYERRGLRPDKKCAVSLVARDYGALFRSIGDAEGAVTAGEPGSMDSTGGHAYATDPQGGKGGIAFVFPGSGNHYVGMGRGIGVYWPGILRNMEAESDEFVSQLIPGSFAPWRMDWGPGWVLSTLERIRSDPLSTILGQVTHGAAVSRLVETFGVSPSAVIGHSLGESAGLFATGAWRDRDEMLRRMRDTDLFTHALFGPCEAVRQAWQIPGDTAIDWCAAAVNRSADQVREALTAFPYARLLIVNTDEQCVIGGLRDQVDGLVRHLGCEAVPLDGVIAVHCDGAGPAADAYENLHLLPTTPPPGIRYYSCTDGNSYIPTAESAAASIRRQAVSGVDFPKTVRQAYRDGFRVFVEMGPHASCTAMINHILSGDPHLAVSACVRGEDDYHTILKCMGTLISERVPVDLTPLYGGAGAVPTVHAASDPAKTDSSGHETTISLGGDAFFHETPTDTLTPTDPPPPVTAPTGAGPREGPTSSPEGRSFSELAASLTRGTAATSEAHMQFLSFSRELSKAYADALTFKSRLVSSAGPATAARPIAAESGPEPAGDKPPSTALLSREMCMEFAVGSIAKVLGPAFSAVDSYPYRVRLPDEPLMLVDRILSIDGEMLSLGAGRVVTEHDVRPGAWYLDGGHAPVCISVEAGQADLFLCAYLGIDQAVRGERVYRLLDATVEFHRGLPLPGDVIRYEITIEKFARQGETYLFFFNFKGYIGRAPLITMTEGCAGFFTPEEVKHSGGIVLTPEDTAPAETVVPMDRRALAPIALESYDDAAIDALRRGDLSGCFGACFEGLGLAQTLRLPGGRMRLIDRVLRLDPDGGHYGLGSIRAEADIHPDDWFLTCHFRDDMVMPGTLMYECCAHTLRVFMQRMGWVSEKPGTCYGPLPGVRSTLKCRGPVTPDTRRVHYEVHIKKAGYGPEPYIIADAHMFADGLHIVMFRDMAMKMTGVSRDEMEAVWRPRRTGTGPAGPDTQATVPWDRNRLITFSTGRPSEAFGPRYREFDEERFIARLPAPPFLFIDRITHIDPRPWLLEPDGWIEAEYDLAPDDWYYRANRMPCLPFVALLEIALQPCGWLAAYMGSALKSRKDLRFRNLGGTGTVRRHTLPRSGTLITRARCTRISDAGDMIIEHFDFEVSHRESGGKTVYAGNTNFGFFTAEAMAAQVGIRDAAERMHTPDAHQLAAASSCDLDELHPRFPDDLREEPHGPLSVPGAALRMVDAIDAYLPEGGPRGLGFVQGSKTVDPDEWFFKAHFLGDPVCPGSLGIESFMQLLRFVALSRWPVPSPGMEQHRGRRHRIEPATTLPHRWIYRGQVVPDNRTVTVSAQITDIRKDPDPTIHADGFLMVDGLCIYEMRDFGVRLVSGG